MQFRMSMSVDLGYRIMPLWVGFNPDYCRMAKLLRHLCHCFARTFCVARFGRSEILPLSVSVVNGSLSVLCLRWVDSGD